MWFSKSVQQTLKELEVDPQSGLSQAEAQSRLKKYGPNRLEEKKKKSVFQLFLAQLDDTLIYVLFGAVLVTLFMGEYIDSIVILLVIIINAVLGVVQEVKAGKAIEALQKIASPKALVKRDGEVREIASENVVPGDVLILDAGRFVAADLRLIESANLQIEESALTGESVPVSKDAETVIDDAKTPVGDRVNSAFMSTLVTYGRGVGVAVETGMSTQVGKIADILDTGPEPPTPLEKRLDELGTTLGKLAIGVCFLIFIVALLQGRELAEMFLTAVSLAVASIPEGLAAIVAVVLSIGVTNMSKRNAIIKRLPAVETLGSVNIVCSDKTGTLTQNKMTVTQYLTPGKDEVTVEEVSGKTPPDDTALLAKAMILCSDATLEKDKGTGDPTEIALLAFGDDLGLDRKKIRQQSKRVGELAFDSERKLMSTMHEEDNSLFVYTKGAIDNLLNKCSRVLENGKTIPLTEEHRQQYLNAAETMSAQALRTLAAATKPVQSINDPSDMETDLIFLGLVGMIDPPRQEVRDSIQKAKRAGVTTIMITGDHKNTAFAIAKALQLAERRDQVITGKEIEAYSDKELEKNIDAWRIFARVSPQHKVKIVRALKSRGNIVSMTGDGVNDAPSLTTADIGVAMGVTGTDVAKDASDMILTDDNFATIISAIEQGRNIYNNIKKSVLFLLTCNLGEVVAMCIPIFAGLPAPLIASQLLWINLLTDSLPAIALGMDPGDPDVMKEKPRPPKESFFAHGAGLRAIFGGVLIGLLTIFAFWYGFYEHGYNPFDNSVPEHILRYTRTMAFMTIVSCQMFYSLAFRNHIKSIFKIGIFSNKYLIATIVLGFLLQLIVIGIPVMQDAFKLQMLGLWDWIQVIALGFVVLPVSELFKMYLRRKAN
jgi:Ca2+-transporting ATPase